MMALVKQISAGTVLSAWHAMDEMESDGKIKPRGKEMQEQKDRWRAGEH